MIRKLPVLTVFLVPVFLAILASLVACGRTATVEGQFLIDDRSIKVEELKRGEVYAFLVGDWARFEKHVKDTKGMFSEKIWPVDWHLEVTPPFPTDWPPQQRRSVTYYAYAEYQELYMHGPVLSRSAPWAKVILNEGEPAKKVLLATTIGPVVHGEGRVPISRQQADRKIQIIGDGEAHLSNFVRWTRIADDEAEVKAEDRREQAEEITTDHVFHHIDAAIAATATGMGVDAHPFRRW